MTEARAVADEIAAERQRLLDAGYRDIGHVRALRVGSRVRHRGEQYGEALRRGTGVVRVLMEKRPSAWAKDWGRRDIELVVESDKPRFSSKLMQVADYHVAVIDTCYWCDAKVSADGSCSCPPRITDAARAS